MHGYLLGVVRRALQVVLFFVLVSVVIGLSSETGLIEKALLVVSGAALIWVALLVRRIGAGPTPRST